MQAGRDLNRRLTSEDDGWRDFTCPSGNINRVIDRLVHSLESLMKV
jgi:hypothetical protein